MSMKEILQELAAKRDRLQKISMGYFAMIVLVILLLFIGPGLAGMILGVALLAFYFVWLRRQTQEYSDTANRARILNGLCAPLKDPVFLGSTGLTVRELEDMAMLPVQADDHGLLIRQGFEGKKDAGTCRGWEVTFHYQLGAKRTSYAFLSGTLMTKAFDREIAGMPEWVAVRRELVDEGILAGFLREKGYTLVNPENADWKNRMVLGLRNGKAVPEKILPRVAGFFSGLERVGAVHCTEKEAAVFLDHRFYTDKLKVRDLPTEEQLRTNPLPERDEVWDFFQFLQRWREEEKPEQTGG